MKARPQILSSDFDIRLDGHGLHARKLTFEGDTFPGQRPTLLAIQGADDEYGTPAQLEAIARQVSGPVKPLLIPRCGHVPHRDARSFVLNEIASFIASISDFQTPS